MKYIELTQGKTAIVDDEDFEYLSQWKWYATADGYAVRNQTYIASDGYKKQRRVSMHRDIMGNPKGYTVDHANRDKADNRKENLRTATNTENLRNQGPRKNNSGKYKGVTKASSCKNWSAAIFNSGKRLHLGHFATQEQAALAYNEAAKKYHGEFAYINEVRNV